MSLRTLLTAILWITPVVLQVAIVIAMVRRGTRRAFPMFWTYTLFQIISSGLLAVFYRIGEMEYFFAFWTEAAMSAFLGFAVIYEAFGHALRPYETLRDLGRMLARWVGMVMALVAVIFVMSSARGTENHVVISTILTLERGIRIMQCGMLLLLYLFAHHVGISWKNQLFGIVLGFGTYASANLVIISLMSRYGHSWTPTASLINSTAYLVVVAIWTGYMLSPAAETKLSPVQAPLILQRWNAELEAIDHPRSVVQGAFLPGLEDVVDRIMARGVSGRPN